ncbi:MAG: PASTA domain-containing protein [Mangrovibacterium sp.]
MSFKAFLSSKVFLLNLGVAALITLILLIIVLLAIRSYTDHGESFAIPDFQNMDMEEVRRLTEEKNLHFEITDSLYTENAVPGTVIDQFPVPGFFVKEGRTVFLTICARNPEQVVMPTLTDISLRQAVNIMQGVGLNVGKIEYVPSEYPNLVLEQKFRGVSIASGKMIDRGSNIDLVVGKSGSGEMTIVPDLTGITLEQARNEITVLNLSLGAVIYDGSVLNLGDSLNARIWQQRPESSREMVNQGTSVDLWLTVDENKLSTAPASGLNAEQENEVIEW